MNDVKHSKSSCTNQDELSQMTEQLLWYHWHQAKILDYQHQFLVDFYADDVER